MYKDIIRNTLNNNGYKIKWEGLYKQTGYRFKTTSGTSVFLNAKGTYWCQGKQKLIIKKILDDIIPGKQFNKKVFIVFGRDSLAKNELVALLGQWDLTPIILSDETSAGNTIIESLEKYMKECNYGIVLATPDDIGYLNEHEDEKRFRMRQNVIFEIGMLFFALGRMRTSLIIKDADTIEIPTDISGIKRIQFSDHVYEIESLLEKELLNAGYKKHKKSSIY